MRKLFYFRSNKSEKTKKVCIFCGSRNTNSDEIKNQVIELAILLVRRNVDLVYGGGSKGIMGLVSKIFTKEGRSVVGVRTFKRIKNENSRLGDSQILFTKNLFDRKRKMIELSDYFVVLPGGIGTLDEAFEIITSNRMRFTNKKVALFNCCGFYNDLINQLKKMIQYNFISSNIWNEIIIESDPQELVNKLFE